MENLYFSRDTYTTPEGRRKLGDKLFFNTRAYFVIRYIKIILKYRKLCIKGLYDRNAWAQNSKEIFDLIEDCGGRVDIKGLNNIINDKEPTVYVANHMSTLESMVLPSLIAPVKPATFIVKKSLLTFPFFGHIMRACNPIAVNRINPREDYKTVMDEGMRLLKEGTSIIIFPESTRYLEFDPKKFGSLGVKLAKKAGVNIVPIALKTDFWGNSKTKLKDLGPIDRDKKIFFEVGQKMNIEGKGNEVHEKIVTFISEKIMSWGGSVKEN